MTSDYEPFVIQVDEPEQDQYPVRADFLGTTWSAVIPCSLPSLTEQEISQAKSWLERGFIDRDYTKDFGGRLFKTLFQDVILNGFRVAYERVAQRDDGLRVVLILPQALAELPWELMYDGDGGHGFLARSTTAPLVRHYNVTILPHAAPKQGPLRILVVTASPRDLPEISSKDEAEKISESLSRKRIGIVHSLKLLARHLSHSRSIPEFFQRLRHRNLFEISTLSHASKSSFQKKIREAQENKTGYHVVHFIGHGKTNPNGSYLAFESEDKNTELVTSDDFAEILSDSTINLAVLNACETASATSLFQSVAQATLQRGVPTVIGMQVPILDRTAVGFAEEFYGAWASGQTIESSLSYARRLIKEETPGAAADWGIPVLFMRAIDGLRLDLVPPPPRSPILWRLLRWTITTFISLLGIIGLLFTIPDVNQKLRTEVPIIRCIFPYPMEKGFNIVVNQFTVLDKNGSLVRSKDGIEVADYIYQQLDFNMKDLDLVDAHHILKPEYTCPIKGETREERDANAAAFANRVHANIIVYGVIEDSDNPAKFSPEFYVNYKGFEEGEEITGQHELGAKLAVFLPFDSARFTDADNPALSARTKALSLLSIGLTYYSVNDFEQATNYFLQSKDTKGWSDTAGKEVLYLLLGNVNNRRASKEKNSAYLQDSFLNYDHALGINPNYARAMVGKAGALYLLALGDLTDNDLAKIDLAKLDEATRLYNKAMQLKDSPETAKTANIETKVHFGLGQIYYARYLNALVTGQDANTLLSNAETEFQTVLTEYNGGNDQIGNLAGHSYAWLGSIARLEKRPAEAVDLYKKAIDLVTLYYQSYYTTRIGEVYVDQCQIEPAIKAYEDAISSAEFGGYEEAVTKYKERLEAIKTIQCQP